MKKKILIVDDSHINNALLTELLTDYGFQTESVKDGEKAVAKARSDTFDLILLDIMMPEMNGFEVCTILKSDPTTKDIPIIFLTARQDIDSIAQGFELGAVDYVVKPFMNLELVARIRTHIELKETKSELIKKLTEKELAEQALLESNQRFQTIFTENNSIMLLFEPESGIIDDANYTAAKFYGYSIGDLCTKTIYNLHTGDDSELKEAIQQVIIAEKGYFKFKNRTSDGSIRDVEIYCIPIKIGGKIFIIATIHDITDRRMMQKEILSAIIRNEGAERTRFAKDLHDGLGALLSSVKIYLNILKSGDVSPIERDELFESTKTLIDESIRSAKEIANNIRPTILTDFGLFASLKSFCDSINRTRQIKIVIQYDKALRLSDNLEVILYRVVNELINNTLSHASARNIKIVFTEDNGMLKIKFADDGIGFDVEKAMHLNKSGEGLNNIMSRINSIDGTCNFKSSEGKGVRYTITIPL